MDWQEWINAKYLEWRGNKIGNEGSVNAWARWLGVKQQTVNSWIREGKKPDTVKTINALVARFGGEVYDVLGLAPPGEDYMALASLQEIARILKNVPPDHQFEAVFAIRDWAKENGYIIAESNKKQD